MCKSESHLPDLRIQLFHLFLIKKKSLRFYLNIRSPEIKILKPDLLNLPKNKQSGFQDGLN